MDFTLDADHLALADAVRRFCDAQFPAHRRGDPCTTSPDDDTWARFAALGLAGLMVDDAYGGSGLTAVEAGVVAEELGRALAADAWVTTAVACAPLIARLGTAAQRERWLAPIAQGTLRTALAAPAPASRLQHAVRAQASGNGWRLDGRIAQVPQGDAAGLLLVAARTDDDPMLFALDAATPGLRIEPYGVVDGTRAACLVFDAVLVADDRRLGDTGDVADALLAVQDACIAALVAEAAGAMAALASSTAEHLRTRRQFGAPLSQFQVLQHRIADLVIDVEQVRSMAGAAAMAVAEGTPQDRARIVSAAKVLAGDAGRRAGRTAIQLHGAMGMTDDCRVGRYAKRLLAIDKRLGDAAWHLDRFDRSAAPVLDGPQQ